MLDLHRLRLLKEFAGRGTIAATAAALGYTPSAVSQQLAVLERETGVILLDRTARSAELTDAGVCLAAHAERILAQVEEAEADMSAQEREPTGRVSVAAFPTAAAAFAPALARSLRAHPRLTLLLRQTQKDEGLSSVRWGEVEVALVDDWTGHLTSTGAGVLQFYPLVRDPLVLVVPRGHPLADPAEPVTCACSARPAGGWPLPRASRPAWPWTGCSLLRAARPPCPGSSRAWAPSCPSCPAGSGSLPSPAWRWPRGRGGSWCATCPARTRPRRLRGGPDGQRPPALGGGHPGRPARRGQAAFRPRRPAPPPHTRRPARPDPARITRGTPGRYRARRADQGRQRPGGHRDQAGREDRLRPLQPG